MYSIYLADKELTNVILLPILPEKLPEVSKVFKNETFETYNDGDYNFIGNVGLTSFTLETFFPEYVGKYEFEKSTNTFIDFLSLMNIVYDGKKPIRVIFATENGTILDDFFTVENFSYYVDNAGDYQYKLEFKQYREVT